jgi:cyclopropane fatty-acyl-phospholipid synthase-like methyltransferase
MTDQQARIELREQTYGTGDLGALSIFGGGFINFGYWRGIPLDGDISLEQRIASQQALYDLVLDELGVAQGHRVLEVGSGRGLGAASALRRDPALVRGIDLMPEQVGRARAAHSDERLAFEQGSASAIPFADGSFDRVLSVEAAQHFEDIAGFAWEGHRVLAPGGRLAVSTFFTKHDDAGPALAELLDTFQSGLDLAHPLRSVMLDLAAAGFVDVTALVIGDHVWAGFDKWIAQSEFRDSWGRNWIQAVQRGLVDYYLVTAVKPVEAGSTS